MVKTNYANFMCQREPEAFWTRWWRDKSSELWARHGSCVALWLEWWSAVLSPRIPGFDPRPVNKVSLGLFCRAPQYIQSVILPVLPPRLIFTFISHRRNTVLVNDRVFQYLVAPSTAGYQNMQKEAFRSTRFRRDRVPCLLISQHTAVKTLKKEKFYCLGRQNNKINWISFWRLTATSTAFWQPLVPYTLSIFCGAILCFLLGTT
jgi:hypothetical protein